MNDRLKQSVQNYLGSKKLNKSQVDELEQLIKRHDSRPEKLHVIGFNVAAAVLVSVIIASLVWIFNGQYKVDMAEMIAEEVAYNHLKMTPIEVSGSSLDDMRTYFSKLDFSLSHSQYVADKGLQLIGGRYCSIQGDAAAQLRMKDTQTGDIQIIYQAPYDKESFKDLPKLYEGQVPTRKFFNGIAVDIWVEQGVLFARSFKQ